MTNDIQRPQQPSASLLIHDVVDERTPLIHRTSSIYDNAEEDIDAGYDKPVSIRRHIRTACCCGLADWRLSALIWIAGIAAIIFSVRFYFLTKAASLIFQILSGFSQISSCGSCFALITTVKQLANLGDRVFVNTIQGVCIDLKIQHPDVCRGAIARQGPIIASTLRRIQPNKQSASMLCNKLWGMCPSQETPPDWPAERFPPAPLPITSSPKPPNASRKTYKIVHISDLHVDPDYTPGAEADCNKPLCCRADSAMSGQPIKLPASQFGSARCDTSPRLFRSMLSEIMRVAPDALFVASTGDVVEHSVWLETQKSVMAGLRSSYSLMRSALTMPVYPAPGNHDISPTNDLPRSETNTMAFDRASWYYDEHYSAFAPWIGAHVTRQQFHDQRAHYSVAIAETNLRIISLDTNTNNRDSFYAYDADVIPIEDPEGRLQWLIQELTRVEQQGERAIIIAHGHPVGFFAHPSHIYWQIVNRFNASIVMQLFGHAHVSHYSIHYSSPEDRSAGTAISSAFIGGSLTPYGGVNPGFRVYEIDADTSQLLDYTDYFVDLSRYNATGTWAKLYSAREEFGAMVPLAKGDPITPGYLHHITTALQSSSTNFDRFIQLKYRGGVASLRKCRLNCYKYTICALMRSRSEDRCPDVLPLPDAVHNETRAKGTEDDIATPAYETFDISQASLLSQNDMRSIFMEVQRRLSTSDKVARFQ